LDHYSKLLSATGLINTGLIVNPSTTKPLEIARIWLMEAMKVTFSVEDEKEIS
tara:strand:- start:93242 stop:93400 length:159 start_codon:yes stop_codon:yes gene_type:complete